MLTPLPNAIAYPTPYRAFVPRPLPRFGHDAHRTRTMRPPAKHLLDGAMRAPVSSDTDWCALPLEMKAAWSYGEALQTDRSYQAYPVVYPSPMIVSVSDWNAFSPTVSPLFVCYGEAWSASGSVLMRDGRVFTSDHIVYAIPFPAPVTAVTSSFTPNTAPLVAARERKEADLLIRVKPENDCLHVEPPAVAAPAPNGHQPALTAEHVITPTILVDGKPETVEAQQRRRASCTLAHGTDQTKRTVFYDREAVTQ